MIKKFWAWFWGEPQPDVALEMLKVLVQNQEKTQQAMMGAVDTVVSASVKQAEVLSNYIKLFQSPGAPESWKEDTPEEESQKSMKEMGFNSEWTEAQQAQWVIDHINSL